ncbi:MAG: (S)-ureidoglycine aminohydrolase [Terriglobia bacterium]|nr:MAG: (S)-ureidoglycine aminohydrolase [Terriglobia bacterium]
MHQLGQTRSAHYRDHLLQTPDTFVRAPLPGMCNATAIVHIGPAGGARFTQYTAEFAAGGSLQPTSEQRFLFVLEGELTLEGRTLHAEEYAYVPAGRHTVVEATISTRAAVIEKPYQPLPGLEAPGFFARRESEIEPKPLMGDPALEVRTLLPDDPAFDCAVNTMTFQPGAALPMVEIHVMEHGLLMLAGGGIYRLGDCWYPVSAGDFIWMAPYCPQWFGALGKAPARYLIYKDWNRNP